MPIVRTEQPQAPVGRSVTLAQDFDDPHTGTTLSRSRKPGSRQPISDRPAAEIPARWITVNVLLSRPELPVIARIDLEFQKLGRLLAPAVTIRRVMLDDDDPATLAEAILATTCDAVILYGRDDPVVVAAIDAARTRGVVTAAILSDIPQSRRLVYAGNDHHVSGQTAGLFARSMLPLGGDVAILAGFAGVTAHGQRIAGFRTIIDRDPSLHLRGIAFGRDDRAASAAALRQVLSGGDVRCIFNVGAGNLGVEDVILDYPAARRPVFIGYELTTETKRLLGEGIMTLAIDQNPELQLRYAVEAIQRHFGQLPADAAPRPGPATAFTVYTPGSFRR